MNQGLRMSLHTICLGVVGLALYSGCRGSVTAPADTMPSTPDAVMDVGGTDTAGLAEVSAPEDVSEPLDSVAAVDVPMAPDVPATVDVPPVVVDHCESLGMPKMPMNTEGPFGYHRHELADDFVFYPVEGDSYKLSDLWTGCDSYVFITNARANSPLDPVSIWERDLDGLIAKSPKNVHYFFIATTSKANVMAYLEPMQARVDEALAKLSAEDQAFWKERLHVAGGHPSNFGSWIGNVFTTDASYYGFAIDRAQRIRLLGSYADVTRYQAALEQAGHWPWENNMAYAAHEVRMYNYEALRDAKLAAEEDVTIVSPWSGEVIKGDVFGTLELPDAATMATFDTLQIDWEMDCPDPLKGEFGNCGEWDYLSHIYIQDESNADAWIEVARFITTYHREGRYVVDATPMLALMRNGGSRAIKVHVSPSWNQQAYLSQMDFRLSNQGKGDTPATATFLWSGAGFNAEYNSKFAPQTVDIPATAKRVELWAIITGHGMKTQNCAEFCNHQHFFTVNGKIHSKKHPAVGQNEGCIDQIENGMVPNQGGTWWFGRGGWCPGQQVDPWVADVTADVTPGETASIEYLAKLNGAEPPADAGNIRMVSYLVTYE